MGQKRSTSAGSLTLSTFGGAKFKHLHAIHDSSDNAGLGDLEMTALVTCVLENNIMASASIDYLRPAAAATHGDDQVRIAGTL